MVGKWFDCKLIHISLLLIYYSILELNQFKWIFSSFPTHLQHRFYWENTSLKCHFLTFLFSLLSFLFVFGPWDLQKEGKKGGKKISKIINSIFFLFLCRFICLPLYVLIVLANASVGPNVVRLHLGHKHAQAVFGSDVLPHSLLFYRAQNVY